MAIIWNPTGKLDIATDPADLPVQVEGKVASSGAMTRCTNLYLDEKGIAKTRRGSAKINAVAMDQTAISRIIEQGGVRYSFNGSKIYLDETSIATGLTAAEWSAFLYNPYNSVTQEVYALNGTDRKVIDNSTVREWGVAAPTSAPIVNPQFYTQDWESGYIANSGIFTQDATGDYQVLFDWEVDHLAGTTLGTDTDPYKYMWAFESGVTADTQSGVTYGIKYTYIRKNGTVTEYESNPSSAATWTTISTTIPVRIYWSDSGDSQITHVRFYRTLADGTRYYQDTDFAVGTLKGLLSKNESSLGSECDWTNHSRPPLGTRVLGPNYGGTCFIIKDNLLYFCLPNQPEYWPENYYIEVCPIQLPLKTGAFLDGQLCVANSDEIYAIQGTGATSFFPLPMSAITGTQSVNCFEAIKGFGIIHLGTDGLYQYTGGKDQKITTAFQPLFDGTTKNGIPGLNRSYMANCILKSYQSKFWFGYPGLGAQYPDNFLVWDFQKDQVIHHQYPVAFRTLAIDHHNKRLLAGDIAGYVWEIDKLGATDDAGSTISWAIQGGEYSQLRKYFPRYARYDVNVEGTATGEILLDDVTKQTHTLTGNRLTKKRLVDGCTGDRLSMRITGTGQVNIYGVEIE